ncbi:hypothetical protein DLM45_10330 [Hyphomicrobium methylovorum]|uniref:thioredoxin fold domain-containing protein n=1 Tax=Hyphomicrobium methylovorum TaxID=84 RepID=UPI0015E6F7CD|nr:thioredoxin fold domain-containing protein [Hyphomicrobium methylovorum]MBA2126613.1 hypothetical protein [Hyphomicrobium methylovorum]
MLRLFTAATFALLLATPLRAPFAGLDGSASPPAIESGFQLIVVEADGCIYCKLFRRDVLPAFQASNDGKDMPVRFIDVNVLDNTEMEFTSPVDIVPTFIVVKSNREIDRIAGYVGPENFFHSIHYLRSSAP